MALSICVYCSSSNQLAPHYPQAAAQLGRAIGERGHQLVYGGGKVGLMGIVARSAMEAGARVTGVIPEALVERELALQSVDELIVTSNMHERKATMALRADAFIALPGGFGTWEEIIEIVTHRLLSLHAKPCVILNLKGYYDPLLEQFERGFVEGFVAREHRCHYEVAETVEAALDTIETPSPAVKEI